MRMGKLMGMTEPRSLGREAGPGAVGDGGGGLAGAVEMACGFTAGLALMAAVAFMGAVFLAAAVSFAFAAVRFVVVAFAAFSADLPFLAAAGGGAVAAGGVDDGSVAGAAGTLACAPRSPEARPAGVAGADPGVCGPMGGGPCG